LRLRILTTTHLELAHHLRGDYDRVVELATNNLATLSADSVDEYFGLPAPASGGHAPPPQGRLGDGTLGDRELDPGAPD
jgi:hypothetical protein